MQRRPERPLHVCLDGHSRHWLGYTWRQALHLLVRMSGPAPRYTQGRLTRGLIFGGIGYAIGLSTGVAALGSAVSGAVVFGPHWLCHRVANAWERERPGIATGLARRAHGRRPTGRRPCRKQCSPTQRLCAAGRLFE
ncbi:hypothetical protein MES4922_40158 [Mesorhizobium ventifaucium]|uniref:DUF2062 domain-containing protein n=1 Tax=Mesorhizobium ventifaucium TaxID=666020 RepID=A0ABM9E7Z5_9HYPH|nr:hypothetical protein MES4922_40158 [Mesorhizobium ventifaucium]